MVRTDVRCKSDIAGIDSECRNLCSANKRLSLPTVSTVGCQNGIHAKGWALVNVTWLDSLLALLIVNNNYKNWVRNLANCSAESSLSFFSDQSSLVNRMTFARVGIEKTLSATYPSRLVSLATQSFDGTNGVHVIGTFFMSKMWSSTTGSRLRTTALESFNVLQYFVV